MLYRFERTRRLALAKALFAGVALGALTACVSDRPPEAPATRAATTAFSLPPMRTFGRAGPRTSTRSNTQIAEDFLDLEFRMESGRQLARLTRFDGPIRVRVSRGMSAVNQHDLDQLLARLRSEAGIDIALSTSPDAEITVEGVPSADIQRAVPTAACFVVPRVHDWTEFSRNRGGAMVDWSTLERRERATIFVPSDAAPQEIRDCLNEELAQALGPLNDLYRLPDSVYNDDNINAVLTGFDMLVLRIHYAPELVNGMSRAEVQARLPAILARLNPAGQQGNGQPNGPSSRAYIDLMNRALAPSGSEATRRLAAQQAVDLALANNWGPTRIGFAYFAVGRLELDHDPTRALAAFRSSDAAFRQSYETRLHTAHVAVQLAAFSLSSGDGPGTLAIVDPAIEIATAHQNAALLATLLMFKSEALVLIGRDAEAEAVRLDSLGWARYGFGSDRNVRDRAREITALNPARRG